MTRHGEVTENLEATLPLNLIPAQGAPKPIRVIVDTGFNGHLTLPEEDIATLGFAFHSYTEAELADGHIVVLRKFEGQVLWNEAPRLVTILETTGAPLVGTAFLENHSVAIDLVPGGTIVVRPLERPGS